MSRAGPLASAGCDALPTVPLTATRPVPVQSTLSAVTGMDWPPCSMVISGAVTGVSASTVAESAVDRPMYFCGELMVMVGPGSRPARNQPAAPPTITSSTAARRTSFRNLIL